MLWHYVSRIFKVTSPAKNAVIENNDILGLNHGQTIIDYLNLFIGDNAKMDVKMVQQWELFGDPSLKIGGYS